MMVPKVQVLTYMDSKNRNKKRSPIKIAEDNWTNAEKNTLELERKQILLEQF